MPSIDLVQDSFWLQLKSMKILGLYPYDSWPHIFKIYSITFYILFAIIPATLPILYFVVAKETDVYVIAQNGFIILQLLTRIFKLLPFVTHPEGTKMMLNALNRPIFNRHLPEQNYILSDIVVVCKYLVRVISSVSSSCVLTWAARPLLYQGKAYPFDIWLPFDPFENAVVYWAMYLYLLIAVWLCAFEDATLDTFVGGLIYHGAGQLRILKDTLMYLNERVERQILKENKKMCVDDKENLKAKIIYKKISECVDHYDAIFEYVSDFESTYSSTIFSQFVGSIIVLCVCILQLTVVEPFSMDFIVTATFFMAFLSQIFLFCFFGTLIHDESDTVINAIYMSEWYTYDQKSKKALLTLMERAKRPMKITVGKLLQLSLETFTTLLRRSYSLLAVLQNY